jgi:hypothetical protein
MYQPSSYFIFFLFFHLKSIETNKKTDLKNHFLKSVYIIIYCAKSSVSALLLLMLWVFTDNSDRALSFDNSALFAHWFN